MLLYNMQMTGNGVSIMWLGVHTLQEPIIYPFTYIGVSKALSIYVFGGFV